MSPQIRRHLDAGLRRAGAASLFACALVFIAATLRVEGLRVAVFDVDATPHPARQSLSQQYWGLVPEIRN
jgi:hypothetical protein